MPLTESAKPTDILELARTKVLDQGIGLDQGETLQVLQLGDDRITEILELAHQVRLKWCGEEIEAEGIISLKTGGCPEDCHFCSQSGLFESPVRSAWLDIAGLVEAAKQTQKSGATEFCIVAAVKGPEVAASVGILTQEQVDRLKAAGVHRYNHNLETARSFFPNVVTTHTWESRRETLRMVAAAGIEVCSGGILGMGESLEQRAEFASDLAELNPTEVPMNFLDPRPGTPFADKEVMATTDALRAIGAFRLALPKTILRFAGGRELTLGDLGTEQGLLGGINAMIVGNYLTTLGRPMENDLDMLDKLRIPLKVLTTSV